MFYLKYRPQKFSEISKPNDAAHALMSQVKQGKVAHAYMFIGSRGVGKTTTARILAKALNCKKTLKSGDPCDKCDSCIAIKSGTYIDLIEIDAASNRGIDDIRDLRDKIKLTPGAGKQKVYIIDEVHMLTREAFNALLKTLEEPPSHATFILCTTEDYKVPETIKSRCQIFKFKRATVDQIVEKLEDICKKEKAKVSKKGLRKIAEAAFGGFRDAETLLQQVVEGSLDIDSFLGVGKWQSYVDFVDFILVGNVNSAIRQINKHYDDGIDLYMWGVELTKYLRDLLFIATDSHEGLVDVTAEILSKMEEQASKFDVKELVGVIEVFVIAQNEVKSSFITQLPLELGVVKACNIMGNGVSVSNPVSADVDDDSGEIKDVDESVGKAGLGGTDIKSVKDKWNEVLEEAGPRNNSVKALLKATRPVEINSNIIVLEVFYKFHKERLETAKNRKTVEKVLKCVFSKPLGIKCVLSREKPQKDRKEEAGELTDYNVVVPANDVFDGSLPI